MLTNFTAVASNLLLVLINIKKTRKIGNLRTECVHPKNRIVGKYLLMKSVGKHLLMKIYRIFLLSD